MLKTRIITALILAPIAIGGIFFLPPLGFALFTGAIISIGAWEWANMSGIGHPAGRIGYALLTALILYGLLNVPFVAVLWLALFLMFSTIALRSVLIHGRRHTTYPSYRVPVSFVQQSVREPNETLPVTPLELPLPGDE